MSDLAVVLEAKGDLRVRANDRPAVASGSLPSGYVRVAVRSTGICGSDVHYLRHGAIGEYVLTGPMILGHESSGEIVEVAPDCTQRAVGQRVAIEPGVPCRRCGYCRVGQYNLCGRMHFAATPPVDGTLQRFYLVPEDFAHPVPAGVGWDEAALMEPLSVAVHIANRLRVGFASTCVVLGAGAIGLLTAAVVRAKGAAQVVLVDTNASRLAFAQKYIRPTATGGVHVYTPAAPREGESRIDYSKRNAGAMLQAFDFLADNEGADAVVDATGAEVCSQTAVYICRRGGVFVQAGMGADDIVLPIAAICAKELTVLGSFRYAEGCYQQAIELVASGLVDLKQLVSHTFAFEQANEAFDTVAGAADGVVKCIIRGQE